MKSKKKIKNFIIDVDGVFTDGSFYYTEKGKVMKKFGPDDADALSLLKDKIIIHTISGDKRGFPITKKRIQDDMGLNLDLVSTFDRTRWIKEKYNLEETIYMGDGIFDILVFSEVAYSIAPSNAFYTTKQKASFITNSKGGEGAVAEAVIHILDKFLDTPFTQSLLKKLNKSAAWEKGITNLV